MPRPRAYSETDVLERATRIFWAQGYDGTSIADLVQGAGISRASLYAGFRDKHGLFLRCLAHYDNHYGTALLDLLQTQRGPAAAIPALFDAAACSSPDRPRGCLMVQTAQERAPHDTEAAAQVACMFARVVRFFHDGLTEAGVRDAQDGAQVLLGMLIGLRVLDRAPGQDSAKAAIVARVREMVS